MAGSRKGEKRGGAKPAGLRKPRGFEPGGTGKRGRPKGMPTRAKPPIHATKDPEIRAILGKHVAVTKREKDLEMYFLVVGNRMRLPKDVMLDAMRYFEETAIDYGQLAQANMEREAAAENPEDRAALNKAATDAEAKLGQYLTMAVDVAYKVAPYIHPRLSAIMTNPGSNDLPLNVLSTLLQDLDEAGRPARYIDHEPSAES